MSAERKNFFIGIAGSSGSGKTFLANELLKRLGADRAQIIAVDSYYRRRDDSPFEERCKINYDHPDALELDLLAEHLRLLRDGQEISVPVYDFALHNRTDQSQLATPQKPVVVVEGILAFYLPQLRDIFQRKIFVDTPLHYCLERRLARDTVERGRTHESVLTQWNETVVPMYETYCVPTSGYADEIYKGEFLDESYVDRLVRSILNAIDN